MSASTTNSPLLYLPARAWGWWVGELRGMLPGWRSDGGLAGRRRIAIAFDGEERTLIDHRHGRASRLQSCMASDTERMRRLCTEAAQRARRGRVPIGVRLPRASCLVRTVRLPAVAPERLTEMLALDLERATPFKTSEVMFGWTVSPDQPESGGPMEIQQVVVKRPIVETALAELSDLGIRAQFVDCWRDGLHAFDANVLASELAGEERERRRSRLLPVLTLLVLALAAIGVMQVLQRQERAIAALRAEVAAATERAAMRNRANALTSLAQQRVATILDLKRNRPAAIAVWNEITRVLPDTAYLSDLMLDGDQLVMSGYAQSAAELVPLLKASPLVADVTLAAQVVFDEAVGRERFDIRVRIATAEPVATAEEALP